MTHIITGNSEWIESTWSKTDSKLCKVAVRSRFKLPYTVDENGVHNNRNDDMHWWWTNGFWGGMMWLMYAETKNEAYRLTAEESCKMLSRIFEEFDHLDHDVGFIWHLTEAARSRLTGERTARSAALLAAASLSSRFNPCGNFIRAWNEGTWPGIDCANVTIIDTVMNLALLYWASRETGNSAFSIAAQKHMDMVLEQHIRPDGSVYHQVVHDGNNGAFKEALPGQGYSADSCWSRGLAWAIYGSLISYVHTREKKYLDACIKTSNYFIANTAKTDWLPPADFRAPKEYFAYDSTASACTACALLELAKHVSVPEAEMYESAAISMLRAIDEKCANYDENTDYLVGLGTERCPREDVDRSKAEMPIIYGDFFYVEAMLKLRGNQFFIW
ncbi:MAG: glycosyl hydrolase family 88 [Ruminococcaceae bacterium]|nr:glycosyl hydrolase family 88 [Oscillospiraceae bacterium]